MLHVHVCLRPTTKRGCRALGDRILCILHYNKWQSHGKVPIRHLEQFKSRQYLIRNLSENWGRRNTTQAGGVILRAFMRLALQPAQRPLSFTQQRPAAVYCWCLQRSQNGSPSVIYEFFFLLPAPKSLMELHFRTWFIYPVVLRTEDVGHGRSSITSHRSALLCHLFMFHE